MPLSNRILTVLAVLFSCFAAGAAAQQTPVFSSGNIVVAVEGCGVQGGFCANVPNGSGTGGSYADNQAAPVTLMQFAPTGTSSLSYVNSLVLPQAGSGTNLPVSGEYGSSSEGTLHLSGNGQYLTFMGYGLGAAAFNASPATYGATAGNKNFAFAQTGSLTGQSYTPVARVVSLIDPYGNVNSSSAFFNVFNLNNPRSAFTATGSSVYLSGQGNSTDTTGGVFYSPLFSTNSSPTAISGADIASSSTNQDTRDVQIYNNTLYVSLDSTQGSGSNRSYLGTLGTPPNTTLYSNNAGPTQVTFYNNASTPVKTTSTSKLVLTASETNGLNASGQTINLSPQGYFFANSTTLYIADTGEGKQTSATTTLGDGGLQKWVYNASLPGWQLVYTLSSGLNLVANATNTPANVSGTTGLYGVTGVVAGSNVYLYATNSTIADTDPTYIYGFTDVLASTTKPSGSFTVLAAAPADSNFKGIALAPTLATGSTSSVTITTVPSGLAFTTSGTGCAAGSYIAPVTLSWTASSACSIAVTALQSSNGEQVAFANWQDGSTNATYSVTAPSTPTVYRANFTGSSVAGLSLSGLNDLNQPGVAQPVSVTAVDASGNTVPGFTGTVTFSSNDASATLPSAYTFQASDAGTHSFSVTLNTAGTRTVTATSGGVSGTVSGVVILNDVWALNGNDAAVRLTGAGASTTSAGGTAGSSSAGGVAFDHSGNVWVTQADTNSFAEYSTSGATLATGSNGGLSTPVAVAIDGAGSVWFANAGGNSISEFSSAGAAISTTGYSGVNSASAGDFSVPSAIAIDSSGGVWVTSKSGNSVTHVIGLAAPVTSPLSAATASATLGARP